MRRVASGRLEERAWKEWIQGHRIVHPPKYYNNSKSLQPVKKEVQVQMNALSEKVSAEVIDRESEERGKLYSIENRATNASKVKQARGISMAIGIVLAC